MLQFRVAPRWLESQRFSCRFDRLKRRVWASCCCPGFSAPSWAKPRLPRPKAPHVFRRCSKCSENPSIRRRSGEVAETYRSGNRSPLQPNQPLRKRRRHCRQASRCRPRLWVAATMRRKVKKPFVFGITDAKESRPKPLACFLNRLSIQPTAICRRG